MSASLLSALRQEGLGARDHFEGRQEPLSWYFRVVALDQSELDILESGAVEGLDVPTALVELAIDELALALANIGVEGLATYLANDPEATSATRGLVAPENLFLDPAVLLGFLNVDIAPPPAWLEERESDPATNEELATRLAELAREIGEQANSVEVHIEGALDPEAGWTGPQDSVRPAGVFVHFGFEIPLTGTGERELGHIFADGSAVAGSALERIRSVFRAD
jgi:hypothetical protein